MRLEAGMVGREPRPKTNLSLRRVYLYASEFIIRELALGVCTWCLTRADDKVSLLQEPSSPLLPSPDKLLAHHRSLLPAPGVLGRKVGGQKGRMPARGHARGAAMRNLRRIRLGVKVIVL